MSSLKSLKTRKTTVQSIEKVTHAMKLISASKLRRSRDIVEKSQAYMEIVHEILHYAYKGINAEDNERAVKHLPLLFGRGFQTYLIIVIGSDRGLCGAFNNNVVKQAKADIEQLLKEGKQVSVLCIGERIHRALKATKSVEVKQLLQPLKTIQDVKTFSQDIVSRFHAAEFDICKAYYTKFESAVVQKVTAKTLIPLQKIIEEQADVKEKVERVECHPGQILLLKDLITQVLGDTVFSILQDTAASEHGSRMTAMDNATKSANETIEALASEYNKKRQAAITTELVEIISGAEVINKQ